MSEEIKFIKPINKDVLIRDPQSKEPLNINGEYKPFVGNEGIFWRRRINDGSCIIVEEPIAILKQENSPIIEDVNSTYKKGRDNK